MAIVVAAAERSAPKMKRIMYVPISWVREYNLAPRRNAKMRMIVDWMTQRMVMTSIFPNRILSRGGGRARNLLKNPSIRSRIRRPPPASDAERTVMARMPGVTKSM